MRTKTLEVVSKSPLVTIKGSRQQQTKPGNPGLRAGRLQPLDQSRVLRGLQALLLQARKRQK